MRRPIVRLGHPILRFPAEPVDVERLEAGEYEDLFGDLRETLETTGAKTLTAPQIGIELQVLAVAPGLIQDDSIANGVLTIVNPMLEPEHGDLVYDWESCFSIPALRGLVPRYPVVRLRGIDDSGAALDLMAVGMVSRVLQHAHDHLSGVVFLDRMGDLRSLAFDREWREFLSETDLPSSDRNSTD